MGQHSDPVKLARWSFRAYGDEAAARGSEVAARRVQLTRLAEALATLKEMARC